MGCSLTPDEKAATRVKYPEFPMQGGPSIPWALAEDIYAAYSAVFGDDQSIERMAQRGGFGWAEVTIIGVEYRDRFGRGPRGWSECFRRSK